MLLLPHVVQCLRDRALRGEEFREGFADKALLVAPEQGTAEPLSHRRAGESPGEKSVQGRVKHCPAARAE